MSYPAYAAVESVGATMVRSIIGPDGPPFTFRQSTERAGVLVITSSWIAYKHREEIEKRLANVGQRAEWSMWGSPASRPASKPMKAARILAGTV